MKQLEKILLAAAAFSQKSRREGLLALAENIEELDENLFSIFKHGMRLAIDGYNSQVVNTILTNMIENEKDANELKLKIIQREAVLCIQAGYNTRMLAMTLLSFLQNNERRAIENKLLRDDDDFNFNDLNSTDDSEEMQIEPESVRELQFSEFFKETGNIIRIAYLFAQKARREGLLALEDELDDIDEEFIKTGLRLVVDGTDSAIIDTILSNRINLEKSETVKRFYLIQKEAVLSIQAGDNPALLIHKLISHINNIELKDLIKYTKEVEFFQRNNFEDAAVFEKEGKKFSVIAANILHRAYKYSDKANSDGFLSLLDIIDKNKISNRDIFEYGINFIIEGVDSQIIDLILSNLIELEKDSMIKRAKMIQKEAVLGIFKNENPHVLFHVLLSFLSDEELEEVKKIFSASKFAEKAIELLNIPSCSNDDIEKIKKSYTEGLEKSIGSMEVISFFNKPYDLFKDTDQNYLDEVCKNEHPQTVASLLAWLYSGAFSAGGIETISGILKNVDRSVEKKIIACLEADDPELAEEIVSKRSAADN